MKAKLMLRARLNTVDGESNYIAQFDANIEWIPMNRSDVDPVEEVPLEILEICIEDETRTFRQVMDRMRRSITRIGRHTPQRVKPPPP